MSRVITFGEIMLRLKSPDHERLLQSPRLEATFGGGEANVAVSLSLFGRAASFVTVLPDNLVAEAALGELRRHGVDVSKVRRTKTGRLGIYFLETGSNQRASTVVYDREDSAISRVKPGDLDWAALFVDVGWFHVTGITPALSASAAETTREAMKAAQKAGWRVSFDLNYRKKLWNYGKTAPEVMSELIQHADVVIANEEDIQKGLGLDSDAIDAASGRVSAEAYQPLTRKVKKAYPNLAVVAVTLRASQSADKNGWSAVLDGPRGFFTGPSYAIDDIVDRVGGGDAFSAGLIFGLTEWPGDEARALEFAVAAGCLKHSVSGDFNLVTRSEVEALVAGDSSGRVKR
jgi:2-dehydro-3-deoxygluconokinase